MASLRGIAALAILAVASALPPAASAPTPARASLPVTSGLALPADDGIPPELATQLADWYTNSTYVPVLMYLSEGKS